MKILYLIFMFVIVSTQVQAQKFPFTNHTALGLLAGNGTKPSFTFQTFNGVKIQKWQLEAGISTGLDVYSPITILPLSAGLAWNPLNAHTVSPIFSLNAGYGFALLNVDNHNAKIRGGYMINPSIGLRVKTKENMKIHLAVGFREQKASSRQTSDSFVYDFVGGRPDIENQDDYRFRRISLILGLSL